MDAQLRADLSLMTSESPELRADRLNTRLPHGPGLRLIGAIIKMSEVDIVCRAKAIPLNIHPLATNGRLANVHLVEYAAQAAALHLADPHLAEDGHTVLADTTARQGVVVTVRNAEFDIPELIPDHFTEGDGLVLRCTQKSVASVGANYRFEATIDGHPVGRGEFIIAFTR